MSKLKKLAGETALYGLGSILPRALNFLLFPMHTRHLFAPDQYGVITNLLAYVSFLNILYTFGMETAFFRFATRPGAEPKRVFNLAQTLVICISLLFSIGFIVLAQPIANAVHVADHPEFIIWLVLIILSDAVVAIPFAKLRLEKKAAQFALAKSTNVLIILALNYYFLKINYNPAIGIGLVFLSNLLANLIYLVFFARTLLSWRLNFESAEVKKIFTYAYPVMLMGLAGMTNEMFSRVTLEWWLPEGFYGSHSTAYALGVFGACYKYAVLMTVAVQAFRYAAEPFFFSQADDKDSRTLFATVNHFFVIVCCVLWLGVSINMDVLKYLTDPPYWEGLSIVPILLLANLFLGVYYNFSVWFKVTDRTYVGTFITTGGAVFTILLNLLLVPLAGYIGSSWATLIVYAGMAVSCFWAGQRYYPIPYTVLKESAYIGITGIIIYGVSQIAWNNSVGMFLFHALVLLIFIAVTYWIERGTATRPAINKAPGNTA